MAKKRVDSHLNEARSRELLKRCIPDPWVVRDLTPDYGVDLVIEVFERSGAGFPTLGEFVFVQLKSVNGQQRRPLKIADQTNVEKARQRGRSTVLGIDAFKLRLDYDILDNARLMGPVQPLLLVLADVDAGTAHFLCLTDYCDKVLEPSGFFAGPRQKAKDIHIPASNDLSNRAGLDAIRFYALRAKFYAMFNLAHYQYRELSDSAVAKINEESPWHDFLMLLRKLRMMRRFAERLGDMPVWNQTGLWRVLDEQRATLAAIADLCAAEDYYEGRTAGDLDIDEVNADLSQKIESCVDAWKAFARLGPLFEDVVRHWWLPTAIGQLASGEVGKG